MEEHPGNEELKFPVEWHYHIVALADDPRCEFELERILKEFSPGTELKAAQLSSSGKYRSFHASVTFGDRESMETLSSKLAAVEGVKFLL